MASRQLVESTSMGPRRLGRRAGVVPRRLVDCADPVPQQPDSSPAGRHVAELLNQRRRGRPEPPSSFAGVPGRIVAEPSLWTTILGRRNEHASRRPAEISLRSFARGATSPGQLPRQQSNLRTRFRRQLRSCANPLLTSRFSSSQREARQRAVLRNRRLHVARRPQPPAVGCIPNQSPSRPGRGRRGRPA
jgi:hypothetical protein